MSPDDAIRSRLGDAAQLLALRRALADVAGDDEPRARVGAGADPSDARRVALLPGSFNPPTVAHVELARAGLDTDAPPDVLLYLLATRTVDKEVVSGATLEDRLLLLGLLAERDPRLGVLIVNRGLYVDQAALVRATFPAVEEVAFVVGYDKVVQIFDPRYYDDRDRALERLFCLARLLVAPRAADGPSELIELLGAPENRRFAPYVTPLALDGSLRHVASSAARTDLDAAYAHLPPESRVFAEECGAYDRDTARYRRRLAWLADLERRGT